MDNEEDRCEDFDFKCKSCGKTIVDDSYDYRERIDYFNYLYSDGMCESCDPEDENSYYYDEETGTFVRLDEENY